MKRMLINATQAEERRLGIVDGQKLLDYEIEVDGREQRKGNIYKGVVTRVEPSLEACFVDYGEERHGFLPFKEISKLHFQSDVAASQARIQDVIKEGQSFLVQVEKEERGNKGAALTSFISLAGRYVVLMPNNPRGGGVSRRIDGESRAELKDTLDQLEYPKGMSIIARTAGIGRSAEELQWDLNYLLKLWAAIDGAAAAAPGAFLIYQESSLVIRAIRDYFNAEIGDILIDADDIYEQARQFMAHVMPEHESKVKRYRDETPLFSRFQIEHQIETAYARTVQLPSGGAIVIDHTEALVSVDVNSARAIRGGDIEETATRTNLEAADEVARQMRLRDLGGLIVIDFIDMDESKNRREVENRLRDALRQDRARVQFGTISKFGLMEMSRQRLRPALSEGASMPCPRCGGAGHIRDTESSALQILRVIQEEAMKEATAAVRVQVPVEAASYLLNEKRPEIAKIELRHRISVLLIPNKTLETPNYKLERLKHDDPRLDIDQSSYKMAEEFEDPSTTSSRSREPTNRQSPVIKGVLPDAPAPQPTAQTAQTAPRGRTQTQPRRQPASAASESPKELSFISWIKSLFVPEEEEKQPAARSNVGRGGSRARGERQQPRGERADNTRSDNTRAESGNGERTERGERNDRAERGERTERGEPRSPRVPRANNPRGNRPERTERGADRTDRPERSADRADQPESAPAPAPAHSESPQRPARTESGEPRSEQRRGQSASPERLAAAPADATNDGNDRDSNREGRENREDSEQGAMREAPRERRSRGIYGRDRRTGERKNQSSDPAAAQSEQGFAGDMPQEPMPMRPAQEASAQGLSSESSRQVPQRTSEPAARTQQRDQQPRNNAPRDGAPAKEAAKANAPASAAPGDTAAPAAEVVPAFAKAQPYELPVAQMQSIVDQVGLQWVHSDAEKLAQVQAQIAAEPKPVHVPRERPPVSEASDEPLVLVETKRDLSRMQFPFQ